MLHNYGDNCEKKTSGNFSSFPAIKRSSKKILITQLKHKNCKNSVNNQLVNKIKVNVIKKIIKCVKNVKFTEKKNWTFMQFSF